MMGRLWPVSVLTLGSLLVLLLSACGSPATADQPPTIRYGRDTSEMGMMISDERFAAGIVGQNGRATLFDDLGDLVEAVRQRPQPASFGRVWVHDFGTKEWMDGTTAFYAACADLESVTPMGSGVAAFKARADAQAFLSQHHGTLMTWDQMLSAWHHPRHH